MPPPTIESCLVRLLSVVVLGSTSILDLVLKVFVLGQGHKSSLEAS